MADYSESLFRLLKNIDADNTLDRLNQIGMLLGNPEQSRQIESILKNLLEEQRSTPSINLLYALSPFLSEKRQSDLKNYIKVFNIIKLVDTIKQTNK